MLIDAFPAKFVATPHRSIFQSLPNFNKIIFMTSAQTEILETKQDLMDSIYSFSESNIDKVPFKDSWTAGQVLEHIDKAIGPGILYGKTQKVNREPGEKVQQIKAVFLDFDSKMKSPDFILPTEEKHSRQALLESLTRKLDALFTATETLDMNEECLDFEVPGFGKFTRLEWIWFYLVHTQRHVQQLKNISKEVVS